jgi:hypothetical protein
MRTLVFSLNMPAAGPFDDTRWRIRPRIATPPSTGLDTAWLARVTRESGVQSVTVGRLQDTNKRRLAVSQKGFKGALAAGPLARVSPSAHRAGLPTRRTETSGGLFIPWPAAPLTSRAGPKDRPIGRQCDSLSRTAPGLAYKRFRPLVRTAHSRRSLGSDPVLRPIQDSFAGWPDTLSSSSRAVVRSRPRAKPRDEISSTASCAA